MLTKLSPDISENEQIYREEQTPCSRQSLILATLTWTFTPILAYFIHFEFQDGEGKETMMHAKTFIDWQKWYEAKTLPFWYQCILCAYVSLVFSIMAYKLSMWADNNILPLIKDANNNENSYVIKPYKGRKPDKLNSPELQEKQTKECYAYRYKKIGAFTLLLNLFLGFNMIYSIIITISDMQNVLKSHFDDGWIWQNALAIPLFNNVSLRQGWLILFNSQMIEEITEECRQLPRTKTGTLDHQIFVWPQVRNTKVCFGDQKYFSLSIAGHSFALNLLACMPFVITHILPGAILFIWFTLLIGGLLQVTYLARDYYDCKDYNAGTKYIQRIPKTDRRTYHYLTFILTILCVCIIYFQIVTVVNFTTQQQMTGNYGETIWDVYWSRSIEKQINHINSYFYSLFEVTLI